MGAKKAQKLTEKKRKRKSQFRWHEKEENEIEASERKTHILDDTKNQRFVAAHK